MSPMDLLSKEVQSLEAEDAATHGEVGGGDTGEMVDPLASGCLVDPLVAASGWDPGSMGDGKGSVGRGARVLQTQKLVRMGEFAQVGGIAQRNWKMQRDVSYGVQRHTADGASYGKGYRSTGNLKGTSGTVKSTEARTEPTGTTTIDRRVVTSGGRERNTDTRIHEERDKKGMSHVRRDATQTDFDGKQQKATEMSTSWGKKGVYVDRDGERAGYDTDKQDPGVGTKVLKGFAGLLDKFDDMGRKITGKKKRHEIETKGPQKASKLDAWDEGDHDTVRGNRGLGKTLARHLSVGSIGDEQKMDFESFAEKRDNKVKDIGRASGTHTEGPLTEMILSAGLGKVASGSTLEETDGVDAAGRSTKTRAGATGEASAGMEASASQREKWTTKGAERGVNASASLGAGAKGAAGVTHQTDMGGGVRGDLGVSAGGEAFVGAKGSADASTTVGSSSVSAAANTEAMIGAEAKANVNANAALSAGGFDLVGARAKANGEAMAGAKVSANGQASASLSKGVAVSGGGEAMAGAEAKGLASAGVSAGGVDLDAVAEGEAFAGAEANASAQAAAGWTGFSLGGKAGAFAGAKAGGQVRAELGAGGLNFGLLGVSGEVSAGAGAEAQGEIFAKLFKTGASASAAAAVGVGAGAGMVLTVDPSFPLRLPLEKLAENDVIPSSDVGELVTASTKGVFMPDGGKPVPLDEARSKQDATGRAAIDAAATEMSSRVEGGAKDAFAEVKASTSLGGGLLDSLKTVLTRALSSVDAAGESTKQALGALMKQGAQQASGMMGTLVQAGRDAVVKISQVRTLDPKALLSDDWEGRIDAAVAQVSAVASQIAQGIVKIIQRVRKAGTALIESSVDAGTAPLDGLGEASAKAVGGFGQVFADTGKRAIGRFKGGLQKGEEGVPVEGLEGRVALPVPISPALAEAEGLMGQVAGAGEATTRVSMGKLGDKIAEGTKKVLVDHHEKVGMAGLNKVEQDAQASAERSKGVIAGIGEGAKRVLRPVAAAAKAAAKAAKAAAKFAKAAAKKVAEAVKNPGKAVAEVGKAVKGAVSTVGKVAGKVVNKVGNFFKGLFG